MMYSCGRQCDTRREVAVVVLRPLGTWYPQQRTKTGPTPSRSPVGSWNRLPEAVIAAVSSRPTLCLLWNQGHADNFHLVQRDRRALFVSSLFSLHSPTHRSCTVRIMDIDWTKPEDTLVKAAAELQDAHAGHPTGRARESVKPWEAALHTMLESSLRLSQKPPPSSFRLSKERKNDTRASRRSEIGWRSNVRVEQRRGG